MAEIRLNEEHGAARPALGGRAKLRLCTLEEEDAAADDSTAQQVADAVEKLAEALARG